MVIASAPLAADTVFDTEAAFVALGVSLGLGLLVGLQRERVESRIAGIRTFGLVSLLGTTAGLLSAPLGVWIIVATMLGIVATIVIGNLSKLYGGDHSSGTTTEVAILLMFVVGVVVAMGWLTVGVALGGALAVLLHAKETLHRFAQRLGDKDVRAVMQFVVVTFIVLPVLPDETYDPWNAINPRHVWLMVVLVVGISLGAYVAYKLLRKGAGMVVNGLLGGAISSTATSFSVSRLARDTPAIASSGALIVVLASTMTYARILVEVGVVGPNFFRYVAPPILISWATLLICAGVLWLGARRNGALMPEPENPSQLKSALAFGAVFAVVVLAVAVARDQFGESGAYAVAVISGLSEMNALTLSTASLVERGLTDGADLKATITPETGWRMILIASMSNLVFKAIIVAKIAGRKMALPTLACFGATFLVSLSLLFLW